MSNKFQIILCTHSIFFVICGLCALGIAQNTHTHTKKKKTEQVVEEKKLSSLKVLLDAEKERWGTHGGKRALSLTFKIVSTVHISIFYNQFTLPLTLRHSSSWICAVHYFCCCFFYSLRALFLSISLFWVFFSSFSTSLLISSFFCSAVFLVVRCYFHFVDHFMAIAFINCWLLFRWCCCRCWCCHMNSKQRSQRFQMNEIQKFLSLFVLLASFNKAQSSTRKSCSLLLFRFQFLYFCDFVERERERVYQFHGNSSEKNETNSFLSYFFAFRYALHTYL